MTTNPFWYWGKWVNKWELTFIFRSSFLVSAALAGSRSVSGSRWLFLVLTLLFHRFLSFLSKAFIFARLADATATAVATDKVYQYDTDDCRNHFKTLCCFLTALVLRFTLTQEAVILILFTAIIIATLQVCNAVSFSILGMSSYSICSCCCCASSITIFLIWPCTTSPSSFSLQTTLPWLKARNGSSILGALNYMWMSRWVAIAI